MAKWFINMKKADFNGIARKYGVSTVIARIMRNREVRTDEEINLYLNGTPEDLYDGRLMKDMECAVSILKEKIAEEKKIRIIGDYDIDGVNSTYILQKGLELAGADVDTDIPHRIKDGYGLNRALVDRAYQDGVDTILTCDNGIAAIEEIAYGKEKGMTVIVTDHHEVKFKEENGVRIYQIPAADAVIDPHQKDCNYPYKELCGAGVAYKLVRVLLEELEIDPAKAEYLIENVAIATIGDVVNLTGENRIFVRTGLEMLKKTKNEGLKALFECTGIDVENLNTYHIGFVIGPCINACGRLDTAKRALELLNAPGRREAVMMAEDLKALNESRKEMTAQGVEEAISLADVIIFMDKGEIAQIASPEEMLRNPANDLIRSFLGKHIHDNNETLTISSFLRTNIFKVGADRGILECTELMALHGVDTLLVTDSDDRYLGTVSIEEINEHSQEKLDSIAPLVRRVMPEASITDEAKACFDKLLVKGGNYVVVLNPDQTIAGIVTRSSMARALASAVWGD